MSEVVKIDVVDGIAVPTIDNPPVNALSFAVRKGLYEAVERVDADPSITSIVIAAKGKTFPAGADISEFGKTPQRPLLPELINRIEACTKPVIAGLHGTVLGGGFELALGAHYRLAQNAVKIGLPEVNLGVLPGAGGTQRVPRLSGPDIAVRLMISGEPVGAETAAAYRLIDGRVEGDVASACLALARKLRTVDIPLRPTRDRDEGFQDVMGYFALLEEARDELDNPDLIAPARIIDCIEAALLLPFDIGIAYERAAFEECLESDVSKALRHAFFAERNAAKLPEVRSVEPRPLNVAAVIGAGTMGVGIALASLTAGMSVYLCEQNDEALKTGLSRINAALDSSVKKGKMKPQMKDLLLTRLRSGTELQECAIADVVIEAVPEDMALKKKVLGAVARVAKPGAIIASNTSYLDLNELAIATGRARDVIGLHFFSPAHVTKLLEVVIADATSPDVTASALALAKKMGKFAVPSGVADGFIGNRILTAYRTACDHLLEDGASVAQIDGAMQRFGFRLGPFLVADMAGLDISWARRKRLAAERDPLERYVRIGDLLCESGRFGQKTAKGYYAYPNGPRKPEIDPEVTEIIIAERTAREVTPRSFSDIDIWERAVLAMVNAGAELLRTGVARKPADIDTVMLHGYGFPRWHGGPMQWADARGALAVRNALQRLADEEDQKFWAPSPLFDEVIKAGGGFAALNAS